MRKSIKAVLLSALVLPGTGHFSLKKPVQGSLLLGTTLVCIYFLISAIYNIAKQITAKMESSEIVADAANLQAMVTEELSGSGDQVIKISFFIMVICWIIGVIDSYRVGRLQDKNSIDC